MTHTIKYLFFLILAVIVSFNCSNSSQENFFSSEERQIISSLIFNSDSQIPTDTTNAYEQHSAAATIGQKFYWDQDFSGTTVLGGRILDTSNSNGDVITIAAGSTNQFSCATCHNPAIGFEDITSGNKGQTDEASLGASGFQARHAPTVINSYFNEYQGKKAWLWTGNADSAWAMISRPIEGNPHLSSRMLVTQKLMTTTNGYRTEYTSVFGTPPMTEADIDTEVTNCGANRGIGTDTCFTSASTGGATPANINAVFANFMKAIAAYERKIISKNSALEKWWAGDEGAMSNAAKRGLKLFIGKANCVACHNGPALSDADFHNIGIPQTGGFVASSDSGAKNGFSALTENNTGQHTTFRGDGSFSDDTSAGSTQLALIPTSSAGQAEFEGAFKTPGLRDISKRAPYMHTGQFRDLWEVVNFYNFGGGESNFSGTKDARIIPRNMTNEEMLDLVAFLNELDGETLDSSITSRPTTIP